MDLSERKKAILHAIVDAYIDTAEPVGSKAVARFCDLGLSSATLRNEMAELEEVGLLEKPHTSAGRIPSQSGFKLYVATLMDNYRMTLDEMRMAHSLLGERISALEKMMENASRVLSELTNLTAVATAPVISMAKLKRIELIPVDPRRFLIVMVLSGGIVKNRCLNMHESVPEEVITKLSSLLSRRFSGKSFEEISLAQVVSLRHEMGQYAPLVSPIVDFIGETLHELSESEVYVGGASNLLDFPEFHDIAKAKDMFGLFGDSAEIKELLSPATGKSGLSIIIGTDNKQIKMKDASIVMGNYKIGDKVVGTIGVIGPVRMDYRRAVSHMEYFTGELSKLLFDIFYGDKE